MARTPLSNTQYKTPHIPSVPRIPATDQLVRWLIDFLAQFSSTDHVFQSGNLVDLDRDGSLNGRTIAEADFRENQQTAGFPTFSSKPFNDPAVPVTLQSATDAFASVIADSGASLHRDAVDKRLIEQVRSLGSLGAIINDETVVGGWHDCWRDRAA